MFLKVLRDKVKTEVNPHMIGIFFEDINYGADGGLYAELLENRSFDFFPTKINAYNSPLIAWKTVGAAAMESRNDEPMNSVNTGYVRLKAEAAGGGIANRAYEGCYLEEGEEYDFSFYSRGGYSGEIVFSLVSEGEVIASASFSGACEKWEKRSASLRAVKTVYDAEPRITLSEAGTVDIDMCSLFPKKTFMGRENGLRPDMAQALKDMRPGFMRFPGGCIVEGNGLNNRYRWKDTIGPIETRKGNWNRWQEGGVGVYAPDYYQSYGLGFYEYFLLCEDLECEPLPVLNCGMGCQYQCEETVPLEELDEYIQDALDLIEFANGSADTEWGSKRAEMGHPKPFGMKYLAIGNEQWEEGYFERYEAFQKVLAEKHPEILLISSSGPYAAGKEFEKAWNWLEGKGKDFAFAVDEHYYVPSRWLFNNTDRYDNYDRSMPKVFAGEYACHLSGHQPRPNNLEAALAEAAMMTGFERNADVVHLAAYAPLFAREGFTQWTPDLIFVNNHEVMLTPSYYVQQLFSKNLPEYETEFACNAGNDLYICAGTKGDECIVKIVNNRPQPALMSLGCADSPANGGTAEYLAVEMAENADFKKILETKNILKHKDRVKPVVESFEGCEYELKPFSFTVIRFKVKED
ncbi:MAG: alpha-L-arabinofuranosidase [Oscillospiraceae bacterium]|nr:alpha-L-arabinofuranosidase [Oscillospiraceae bacterium]